MADAVDVSRAKDYVETAAVTDAEVAEETVTVVEEAVEEFDDSSSKIKDKSADHNHRGFCWEQRCKDDYQLEKF